MGDFLYRWQTLIAGMLALAGAGWTIWALRRQAQEDSERKFRSARATIVITLVTAHDYAVACVRWLEGVRDKAQLAESGSAGPGAILVATAPRPDGKMIAELSECVERFPIPLSRSVAEFVSKIQVQHARIWDLYDYFTNYDRTNSNRVGLNRNIDGYIADSVEIVALGNGLLLYGRGQTESIAAPTLAQITAAFHECGLQEIRNVGPWNAVTDPYLKSNPSLLSGHRPWWRRLRRHTRNASNS
jgi:hypothetical protein